MSQVVNMRYPKELLKRIDEFKEKKGFITRTQTIIYLIQYALEQSDNRDGKKAIPCPKAIHPLPTHWANSLHIP
jgi:metal-responsive CopG/Arc/MetJ family transcriptional regulator